jgi:hypothetical protein
MSGAAPLGARQCAYAFGGHLRRHLLEDAAHGLDHHPFEFITRSQLSLGSTVGGSRWRTLSEPALKCGLAQQLDQRRS